MSLLQTSKALLKAEIKKQAKEELCRRSFIDFVSFTKPDYEVCWFHALLADYLQNFAEGRIKKLMIFMPPQHGKSQLVSRHLPAFLLGRNPKQKIVGCSYSSVLSSSFNRDIQRLIECDEYKQLFAATCLNSKNFASDAKGAWLRNSDIFEIVGHGGFYKSVGVGGSLTGTPVDIGIIDDPVKDAVEADSITTRGRNWDWYENVFNSRLHNNSQVLLTMTRWHQDDLAGRILASPDAANWVVLKLPAIKTAITHHEADNRFVGEALWENRHSAEKIKMNGERTFEALYQQNPMPPKGGLIFPEVQIVDVFPTNELQMLAIGLDFGYSNDPTAAMLCGIKRSTNTIYIDQLIYQTGLVNSEIAALLSLYNRYELYCDNEPKSIEELRRAGLRMAKAAEKGAGSILAGLAILREYNICITKRSFGIINEQQKYVYKTDGYGNPTNDPQSGFDHAWDAVRYYALTMLSKKQTKAISYSKSR